VKPKVNLILSDVLDAIVFLPSNFFQTIVTSPPYWGIRDYGHIKQIGKEPKIDHYIASLTFIFAELLEKTNANGTLWLNIGDVYTSGNRRWRAADAKNPKRFMISRPRTPDGLKPKELIGIPWMVAFAVQKAGWHLRSEIIWAKANAMPESVVDRPVKTHEKIFLFSKNTKYYYDCSASTEVNSSGDGKRKLRDLWTVNTERSTSGHPAPFPQELARRCIELTSKPGDNILDPFGGTGTTAVAAVELSRNSTLIELDQTCEDIIRERLMKKKCTIRCYKTVGQSLYPRFRKR
jgi:site-specific DNA-methyltransferase (cytosine-N4-specific)